MANTKGQEEIHIGKETCMVSWSKTGKQELICTLGTFMDLIEYRNKYSELPTFIDHAFKRECKLIMKTVKTPSKKQTLLH